VDAERVMVAGLVRAAVAELPERHVISRRWLGGDERTLQEVGAGLGVTRERVRQIEASAFEPLRAQLGA
jgi:RNA polymerase sigma-32 factor